MSALSIGLSILGILFVVWMYALVFSEKIPSLNFSKLQSLWIEGWQRFKRQPFYLMCYAPFRLLKWLLYQLRSLSLKLLKFLINVIIEIIFNFILRGIWFVFKSLFLAIFHIFD